MVSRNDQPNIKNFNFATESVFNNIAFLDGSSLIPSNAFLLLDHTGFLLLDGSYLLLLS